MKNIKTAKVLIITSLLTISVLIILSLVHFFKLSAVLLISTQITVPAIIGIMYIYTIVLVLYLFKYLNKLKLQTVKTSSAKLSEEKENTISQEISVQAMQEESKRLASILERAIKGLSETTTIETFSEKLLINISKIFEVVQGMVFIYNAQIGKYTTAGTYAIYSNEAIREFELGEGITGQVAKNQKFLYINNIPKGYIQVISGLGKSDPNFLLLFPITHNNKTIAVIELASFIKIGSDNEVLLNNISVEIGKLLYKKFTISA